MAWRLLGCVCAFLTQLLLLPLLLVSVAVACPVRDGGIMTVDRRLMINPAAHMQVSQMMCGKMMAGNQSQATHYTSGHSNQQVAAASFAAAATAASTVPCCSCVGLSTGMSWSSARPSMNPQRATGIACDNMPALSANMMPVDDLSTEVSWMTGMSMMMAGIQQKHVVNVAACQL
jgi:hypothetical protein